MDFQPDPPVSTCIFLDWVDFYKRSSEDLQLSPIHLLFTSSAQLLICETRATPESPKNRFLCLSSLRYRWKWFLFNSIQFHSNCFMWVQYCTLRGSAKSLHELNYCTMHRLTQYWTIKQNNYISIFNHRTMVIFRLYLMSKEKAYIWVGKKYWSFLSDHTNDACSGFIFKTIGSWPWISSPPVSGLRTKSV